MYRLELREISPLLAVLGVFLIAALPGAAHGQGLARAGKGPLKAGVRGIPDGMTYQDYEDANRRILTGLLYSPIPGGVHFYAGEPHQGAVIATTIGAGLTAVILGGMMAGDQGKLQPASHGTVDFTDPDRHYERIPTGQLETTTLTDNGGVSTTESSTTTTYRLQERSREPENGLASVLMASGVAAILGGYLFDVWHGIATIEEKRNRARYKFGKLVAARARARASAAKASAAPATGREAAPTSGESSAPTAAPPAREEPPREAPPEPAATEEPAPQTRLYLAPYVGAGGDSGGLVFSLSF